MDKIRRPLLRWHGGKWKLAPWIISHMPAHQIYVEPYGGVASVLLRKKRAKSEIWNDLDSELVNLFSVLRSDRAEELRKKCALTPFSREEFILSYAAESQDPVERARRLIIKSFFGQGSKGSIKKSISGFRSFRCGSNSPAVDWLNWPETIPLIVERMRGVVIESKPALDLIERYDRPNTLFYVDPPYMPKTRDMTSKYRHELSEEDHEKLIDSLLSVNGMVMLSGYYTDLYDKKLSGWTRVDRKSMADMASLRTESLWLSPNIPVKQMDLFDAAALVNG